MSQRVRLSTQVALWTLSSFVVVGVAQAGGTPAGAQYARPQVTPPKPGRVSDTASGGETLPFTGLSLALIVAAGLALIAVGVFALRRARSTS